ncbi:MAG: hypothetical protein LBB81_08850, partial [Treponema sp.]|nr:hypothetical protein [Treponema sp.]
MNKTQKIGIIALIIGIALVFAFTACDVGGGGGSSSGGGGTPKTSKYTGVNSSNLDVYELVITSSSGSPKTGDSYVLTFYANGGGDEGGRKSSGTITINGITFTLSKGTSLTVTISGDSLTAIAGTITFNDNTTKTSNVSLTTVKDGGDGSLNGTWKKGSETVRFSGSSFT